MIFNLILLISSRVSNIFNYSIYGILSSFYILYNLKLKLKLKKTLKNKKRLLLFIIFDFCYTTKQTKRIYDLIKNLKKKSIEHMSLLSLLIKRCINEKKRERERKRVQLKKENI